MEAQQIMARIARLEEERNDPYRDGPFTGGSALAEARDELARLQPKPPERPAPSYAEVMARLDANNALREQRIKNALAQMSAVFGGAK